MYIEVGKTRKRESGCVCEREEKMNEKVRERDVKDRERKERIGNVNSGRFR